MRIVLWFILLLVVLHWADESKAARWVTPAGERANIEQTQDNRSALPTPNLKLTLVYAPEMARGGLYGRVHCDDPTTVYLAAHNESTQAHETFHVFDCLGFAPRALLAKVNRWTCDWWQGCDLGDGERSYPVAELAADAYASCAVRPRTNRSGYGWQPTRQQFVSTCRILRNNLMGGI